MPELPEVETIRHGLEPALSGKEITGVDVISPASFMLNTGEVDKHVKGAKILQLRRRGKVLIIDLDSGHSLLIHLKMTGQLILQPERGNRIGGGHPTSSMQGTLPDNSTRVVMTLSHGDKLFFNDQRKFGWIKLAKTIEVEQYPLLARMGEEPLSTGFNLELLQSNLERRRSPIKAVLLDQSTVAGLGNIYVDEALHLAGIHPRKLAADLNRIETEKLFKAIKEVITLAIESGGTTFRSYRNHAGGEGSYLAQARVFGREGKPCGECGSEIEKTKVAGRGTHTCPHCQPAPEKK